VIQQAKAINRNIAEIYSLEAEISLLIRLDIPRAKKAALKAVKLDSTNAKANYVLGVLNLCLGKTGTAHSYFLKASEIQPTNMSFRNAFIRVHYYSQDFNQAIAKAKEVLEMDGRSFGALFILSISYAQLGIYDEALKYCDEILKYINNNEICFLRAYILALQNRPDEADRLIEEVLTDEKLIGPCLFYIVLIYTIQDRFDEAFELLFEYHDRADIPILTIKAEPGLKKLRQDERFPIILDRLNLV
jgi:tetratricopeptide (TPR) repeat protein